MLFPTSVGEADLGWRRALLGSVGQRAFAQSLHAWECAREVRATALRSDSDSSHDLRHVEVWLPKKSPLWSSKGCEWAGCEDASSSECYEHNVGSLAIEVVGQTLSSWSYLSFLGRLGGRAACI